MKEKIEQLANLKNDLDGSIWSIFHRWIEMETINFSGPEHWSLGDDGVDFVGDDGCMGCYDPMSCYIPMEFFTNTEDAFAKREKELVEIKEQNEKDVEFYRLERDRKEFERLKEKYGKRFFSN